MRAMRQKVSIILICISACVCAASFFLLPDIAAVQWSGGEAVNFLPGFAVPIIGFAITLLCNFVWSVLASKWDTAMFTADKGTVVYTRHTARRIRHCL